MKLEKEHSASRSENDIDYNIFFINGLINGKLVKKEIHLEDNKAFCNDIFLKWEEIDDILNSIEDLRILKKDYKINTNSYYEVFGMIVNIEEIYNVFDEFIYDLIPKITIK